VVDTPQSIFSNEALAGKGLIVQTLRIGSNVQSGAKFALAYSRHETRSRK